MSESQPFFIGATPIPADQNTHLTAEYLSDHGFTSDDGDVFSREISPGKSLVVILSRAEIAVKNGEDSPIVIAENSPGVSFLEALLKTLTGQNL